ncbi:MAG: Uma2 family endonuclease [Cyanobacteria bacterium RI_101]|nr:Uma2 family endonuclease [Cyanobacteria bacterium RI_101]
MIVAQPQLTLEQFLAQPETKPYTEYIDGQVETKPMPQGQHSLLQARLVALINQIYLANKTVYALPELRCVFAGIVVVPDICVFTWSRLPRDEQGKIANRFNTYPDWLIEILSPEQSANKVIKKITLCLSAGAELAWLVDPEDQSVAIFRPQSSPEVKVGEERLPVLENLSELDLSPKALFDWLKVD